MSSRERQAALTLSSSSETGDEDLVVLIEVVLGKQGYMIGMIVSLRSSVRSLPPWSSDLASLHTLLLSPSSQALELPPVSFPSESFPAYDKRDGLVYSRGNHRWGRRR